MKNARTETDNPYDSPEYQKFVEEMARECKCEPPGERPCDGILAGGLCDMRGNEPEEIEVRNEDDECENSKAD